MFKRVLMNFRSSGFEFGFFKLIPEEKTKGTVCFRPNLPAQLGVGFHPWIETGEEASSMALPAVVAANPGERRCGEVGKVIEEHVSEVRNPFWA
jgi:hypothetical protein